MKKPKQPTIVDLTVAAIEEVKGLDLKVLDVHALTAITDHMVVCTGTSNRHVRSIAENVMARARQNGHRLRGVEGLNSSEWVLVDLVDVVVHVMQAQARLFYQIEKLWDVPLPEAEPKPASKPRRKSAAKPRPTSKPKPKPRPKPQSKAKSKPKPRSRLPLKTKTKKRR